MIRSFAFASIIYGQTEAVLADNSWTEWEAITDCTADCITQNIGTLIYQRSRLNYNVDDLNNSTIPEIENKTEICTADSYCPKWSLWENAPTPCSATCGGGSQSQIRRCLNGVIGQFGCQGPVQQLVRCNEDPCPSWSSWSIDYEGGQSCGPFCRMTKTRSCGVEGSERSILAQIPLPCPGPAKLETGCTPCGSWSEWSEVECSETCGEGKMVVERECLTEEGNYADDCPGQSVKVEECKIRDCPTTVKSTVNSSTSTTTTSKSTSPAISESMNTTLPAIKTTTSSSTTTNTRFVPPTVSLLSPTPPQNIETLLAEGTTQPSDLDEPLITADALLTVLDNLLETNPEEIDLEEIVVQAASDVTAAPKSSSTTTTEKKPITEPTRTSPTSQTQSRISVTSSIETKKLPTTTEAEETNSILQNPDSERTPSPDMIFDTTFVAEELATNFEIASEEDLLPVFLQPTAQEETSTVLTVARTREASKSSASEITFSILCLMILLLL